MRSTLAFVAIFVGATALAACGGGGDDDDDVNFVDAGDDVAEACNPVSQTGCEAGEKCTWVVYSEEPALGKTECVADGAVDKAGACTVGEPGAATGFDDCKAGLYCVNGACSDICTQTDATTCDDGFACVIYADTFDDLGDDSTVGLCAPTCNPVTQDCEIEGQACYLLISDGAGTCAGVPAAAATQEQGDTCYGPMAGSCYLNGCNKGYQAILLATAGSDDAVCGAFCSPVNTYVDNPDTNDVDGGDPANCGVARVMQADQGCGFIQSIFAGSDTFDPSIISVDYGICYNGAEWGKCDAYDPLAMVQVYNDKYAMEPGDDMAKAAAANAELCSFCMTDMNCANAMNAQCNSGVGCLSIEKDAEIFGELMGASGLATVRHIQATSGKKIGGIVLPDGQVIPPPSVE
jgi:hypothetical protein